MDPPSEPRIAPGSSTVGEAVEREPPEGRGTGGRREKGAGETHFRRLTFFGLLAGLCPLIPLPFLDDWVLSRVRLTLGREILALEGLKASREDLRTLVGLEKKDFWEGCFAIAVLLPLFKVTIYLVKKVVRKIVLILTLKECSDRFSEVLHEGYLLHGAVRRGDLGGPAGSETEVSPEVAQAVRQGIVQACEEVDPRPIHQLIKRGLRGSRWLLMTGSRRLAALFRRGRRDPAATEAGLEGEERLLAGLLDRLSTSLWVQSAYWGELEGHYLRAVEGYRRRPPSEP